MASSSLPSSSHQPTPSPSSPRRPLQWLDTSSLPRLPDQQPPNPNARNHTNSAAIAGSGRPPRPSFVDVANRPVGASNLRAGGHP